ncbi:hypothetical protein MAJ_07779, partial [Metarhizium majus ARSEF 297]
MCRENPPTTEGFHLYGVGRCEDLVQVQEERSVCKVTSWDGTVLNEPAFQPASGQFQFSPQAMLVMPQVLPQVLPQVSRIFFCGNTGMLPIEAKWHRDLTWIAVHLVSELFIYTKGTYLIDHRHLETPGAGHYPFNASPSVLSLYGSFTSLMPARRAFTSGDANRGLVVIMSLLCGDCCRGHLGPLKGRIVQFVYRLCEDCQKDYPVGEPLHSYWAALDDCTFLLDEDVFRSNQRVVNGHDPASAKMMRKIARATACRMFSSILYSVNPPRVLLDDCSILEDGAPYGAMSAKIIESAERQDYYSRAAAPVSE